MQNGFYSPKRLIHKEEDTALWAHKVPCRKPEKEKGNNRANPSCSLFHFYTFTFLQGKILPRQGIRKVHLTEDLDRFARPTRI